MNAMAAAHEINAKVLECLAECGFEAPLGCLPTDEEVAEIIERNT